MRRVVPVGVLAFLVLVGSSASSASTPRFECKDNLTAIGFSVTFSTTTNMSGGGSALNTAVANAGNGTRLLITDSATYDPVTVSGKTDLVIEADAGQQPVIQRASPPHTSAGWCLSLQGTIAGFAVRGLTFHGNGNRNTLSYKDDGLLNLRDDSGQACTSADRILVERCDFTEDGTDNANSGPGVLFVGSSGTDHLRVAVRECTFASNANGSAATPNGYAACTVIGFDEVYFQNSIALRTDAVVSRANSHMRGFLWNNNVTTVEDCLASDLGTGGSNEGFKHATSFGSDTASGNSTVRNCVAHNCKRGFRMDHVGRTMTTTNSVYHADTTGITSHAVRMVASSTHVVRDCVLAGAGDGTAFDNAATTEDHNDVYNFGTNGKTLDNTDLIVNPKFQNPAMRVWIAKDVSVKTGASDGGAMGVRYPGGTVIVWCGN